MGSRDESSGRERRGMENIQNMNSQELFNKVVEQDCLLVKLRAENKRLRTDQYQLLQIHSEGKELYWNLAGALIEVLEENKRLQEQQKKLLEYAEQKYAACLVPRFASCGMCKAIRMTLKGVK
jgi:hypothetical protein